MIDRKLLLSDLQKQVKTLEKDLREQAESVEEVRLRLRSEYDRAFKVGRTAATWTVWRDERVNQAAVAWVLGTVFVRFCEDNGLLSDPFLAGPGDRLVLAEEAEAQFFRDQPDKTLRDWLHQAFDAIGSTQAGKSLFDKGHNPLYVIAMSHDAAKDLIGFWRRRGEQGSLVHSFSDELWDTRFLGDLYQDLSEYAKKTYALLQTPEFVEEFILDLTMTPAIDEFGHEQVTMIDPACGSGHFVLGAFDRLLKEWERHAPTRDIHERVRLSLNAVHGVDINPFAVAIARFRLLVAAFRASGINTFAQAASYDFPLHLAVGDSLIKSRQLSLFEDTDDLAQFRYSHEDVHLHPRILEEGRYHVVVGNPPYITASDPKLSALYREIYSSCSGTYALTVPFAERMFSLARDVDRSGKGRGIVGQITSNSFMKREFGHSLIMEYFANFVDFSYVVDSSDAYVPGHATPTVILIGRRRARLQPSKVRVARGVRGEPKTPLDPRQGLVWRAIVENLESPGVSNQWIAVDDLDWRTYLVRFPWILQAGGIEFVNQLESASTALLGDAVEVIGRTTHTGLDDAFYMPREAARVRGLASSTVPVVLGENLRDYMLDPSIVTLFPYDSEGDRRELYDAEFRHYWSFRTVMRRRVDFGSTPEERGLRWFDHSMFFPKRFASPISIAFPFVASHPHFVLDDGGKVFKQTAPAIKLPSGASRDEHTGLFGILNSAAVTAWLKLHSYRKAGALQGGGISDQPWSWIYEYTGSTLLKLPLPSGRPVSLGREIEESSQLLAAATPAVIAASGVPTRDRLFAAEREWYSIRAHMIALQEELDWQVYSLYGLLAQIFHDLERVCW